MLAAVPRKQGCVSVENDFQDLVYGLELVLEGGLSLWVAAPQLEVRGHLLDGALHDLSHSFVVHPVHDPLDQLKNNPILFVWFIYNSGVLSQTRGLKHANHRKLLRIFN